MLRVPNAEMEPEVAIEVEEEQDGDTLTREINPPDHTDYYSLTKFEDARGIIFKEHDYAYLDSRNGSKSIVYKIHGKWYRPSGATLPEVEEQKTRYFYMCYSYPNSIYKIFYDTWI